MKKTQFIILASCCLSFAGIAQNRGIKFNENQPWQEVVEKARQAGKYIFMDCYTVWCGPCKLLDKNVFSNDEIADYYNDGFINAKYNMEKGEGVSLKEKYRVTAYPTLLFIDAKTEEIVHRVVGAGDVKHMLAQAKIAKESSQNLQSLKKQYETGEKNAETLEPYLKSLSAAGMRDEQNKVTVEYLSRFPAESLLEEENWRLLEAYTRDPLSAPLQTVFARRPEFIKKFGSERVNRKLNASLQIATNAFLERKEASLANFNEERFNALLQFVLTVEDDIAPACAMQLYAAGFARRQDFDNLTTTLRDALKYNMVQGKFKPVFLMTYLIKLLQCTDPAIQAKAITLIDEVIATTNEPYTRSSYHEIKAMLLKAYGDEEGARKAKEKGHAHMNIKAL